MTEVGGGIWRPMWKASAVETSWDPWEWLCWRLLVIEAMNRLSSLTRPDSQWWVWESVPATKPTTHNLFHLKDALGQCWLRAGGGQSMNDCCKPEEGAHAWHSLGGKDPEASWHRTRVEPSRIGKKCYWNNSQGSSATLRQMPKPDVVREASPSSWQEQRQKPTTKH